MIEIENTELKKLKLVAIEVIAEEMQKEIQEQFAIKSRVDFTEHFSFMSDGMAIRVIQEVYGQVLEEVHEKYPSGWWQAVKERFAPEWFLNRWPVIWQHIDITARALYPKIPDIPGHGGILNISVMKNEYTV